MSELQSRIALIAIRMAPGPSTDDPQAIVVGTKSAWKQTLKDGSSLEWKPGQDWRYVCYPLSELQKLLDNKADLLAPLDDAGSDPNALGRTVSIAVVDRAVRENRRSLAPLEASALRRVGLEKAYLDGKLTLIGSDGTPLKCTRWQTAVPLRDVERLFFFSYLGGAPKNGAPEPFAAFDTARFVDPKGSAHPHDFGADPPKTFIGSRLVLFPDFAAQGRPGALSALAIHLGIKTAVNGHRLASAAETQAPDRYDTRLFLDMGVVKRTVTKNLWMPDPETDVDKDEYRKFSGWRGACFDQIQIRCSTRPWSTSKQSRSESISVQRRDLLYFALNSGVESKRCKVRCVDPSANGVDTVPVLAALGIKTGDGTPLRADRDFSFRTVEVDDPLAPVEKQVPKRIVWRFQTTLPGYGAQVGNALAVRTIVPSSVPPLLAGKPVVLAEEQRIQDVFLRLEPSAPSRTLLTIRFGDGDKKLDQSTSDSVVEAINDISRKTHQALTRVRDGRPLSLLPLLQSNRPAVPWHLVGTITDRAPGQRTVVPQDFAAKFDRHLSACLTAFEPQFIPDMWKGVDLKAADAIEADATLVRLIASDRSCPRYKVQLSAPRVTGEASCTARPAYQPAVSAADDPTKLASGTRLAIAILEDKNAILASKVVSIGALQLTLADTFSADVTPPQPGLLLLRPLDGQERGDELQAGLSATLRLPVEAVGPAGQDDPDGAERVTARERRQRPLEPALPDPDAPILLPLSAGQSLQSVHLVLTSEEVVTRDRDHTIALSLHAVGEKAADKQDGSAETNAAGAVPGERASSSRPRLLVLDPRPFRVATIEYDPIASVATSEGAEVAVWNQEGEGGLSWRVRDDVQSVSLVLPPQVLGEAMEKNRAGIPGLPPDIQPNQPVAARFGSLTTLSVDPTFADTRFREPGWNLRRMLGSARQRFPGVRLLDLRLELLYGMLARVRTDDVWMTEIAGAIGEPALPLTELFSETHLKRHSRLIQAVLDAGRRRIAVDKLWRGRPDADLRLEEGVSFLIRQREVDKDGKVVRGPATPFRWPVPGGIPDDPGDLIDGPILRDTFSDSDADADSFPGGLAWAFESANILMRVYGRPKSNGGSVRGVSLSSLGGYGSQHALFDDRKSIVETETTQGRVHRYRLERIGRIACLWHRAKHVVVYERTVVPPAQFYNDTPIGLRQDEHLGRAVLRKVEEFVEILTPVRHYPEDGTSVHAAGFLVGAEFKSIKIRVDSSWGSDVRREGWQIPLWNTVFRDLKSDGTPNPDAPANLYPKPQIRLLLAGEGGKEVPHEIDEPEKLYFYTSVMKGEDDNTDLWQPVRDVDFCDLPLPVVADVRTDSADLTDAVLPSEPAHVPGYERFTLGMVAAKAAVAITHGRTEGGPLAALRNVTIARASGLAADNETKLGGSLSQGSADIRAEIDRHLGRVLGTLERLEQTGNAVEAKNAARALLTEGLNALKVADLEGAIASITKKIDEAPKLGPNWNPCGALAARVDDAVARQTARLNAIGQDVLKNAAEDLQKRLATAFALVNGDIAVVIREGAAIQAVIESAPERLKNAIQVGTLAARDAALREVDASSQQIAARIETLMTTVCTEIEGGAARLHERFLQLKQDVFGDLDRLRDRTHADVSTISAFLSGGLKDKEAALHGLLDTAIKRVDAAITSLQEAVTNGGDKVDQASKEAARKVIAGIDECLATIAQAQQRAGSMGPAAVAAVRRIAQLLEQPLLRIQAIAREVDHAEATALASALRDRLQFARGAIRDALTTVQDRLAILTDNAVGGLEKLRAVLDAVLDDAFRPAKEFATQTAATAAGLLGEVDAVTNSLLIHLNQATTAVRGLQQSLSQAVRDALANATKPITNNLVLLATNLAEGSKAIAAIPAALQKQAEAFQKLVGDGQARIASALTKALADIELQMTDRRKEILAAQTALTTKLREQCEKLEGFANTALADVAKAVKDALDLGSYATELRVELLAAVDAVSDAAGTIAEIKASVAAKAAEITREAERRGRQLLGSIQETVRQGTGLDLNEASQRAAGIYQKGDASLRALRALGDPPKTDSLGFNRPEVAYVLEQGASLGINMTPALALVNRAADQVAAVETAGKAVGELLDSFGVRLPTRAIADQLVPNALKGLSLSDLIPDMAGIDFRGLLERVGFPSLDDAKAIKIRHGVDKSAMRAWMEADIDVPFDHPVPLLSFGPVEIVIDSGRFTSHARMSAGRDGTERKMTGNISGDWSVKSGGQKILTFRQTGLFFDDSGKLDFRIQPDKVELTEALRFITDLMAATGQKGGVKVGPFLRGGVPSGVAATLDMVLPSIQSGAFGISNLSLHVLFGIVAIPRFEILSELSVGSRLSPFALNVWLLNGGGYLTQRLSFLPTAKPQPSLTYTLEIGIVAGLGIGFSFGVVSGGVWLQVGCSMAFSWRTGAGGASTTMRVFLLARGNVDVAGIITASITLLFEVSYDGSRMIGAGSLSIEVKISVFFTLSVEEHVEYVFAGEKRTQVDYGDHYDD